MWNQAASPQKGFECLMILALYGTYSILLFELNPQKRNTYPRNGMLLWWSLLVNEMNNYLLVAW
jgi:hypothetical protein